MAPYPKASKSSWGGRGRGRNKRKYVFVEIERTDNNTDSVSSVEKKLCFQYPNVPKGEFLIQYHKTNKIHMKHKVKLLLTVTTAVWYSFAISRHSFEAVGQIITPSLYSGMKVEIVSSYSETKLLCWVLVPSSYMSQSYCKL